MYWKKGRVRGEDFLLSARLRRDQKETLRLWWLLPATWSKTVTTWADPFVVALIFPMMQWGQETIVEGLVSPSLLANLEEFMAIWHAWVPGKYTPVRIRAREEREPPPPAHCSRTVLPFSCGVDSCFTAYRHHLGIMGHRNRQIAAGIVMNGFDIRLDQAGSEKMYTGLLRRAQAILSSVGVAAIPMASNFHQLPTVWGHAFATQLVGGARLLAGEFDTMLIGSCTPYIGLGAVWASHPLTNPLLGSQSFRVADDGGEFLRFQKIQLIAQWPAAMRNLRVCFENPSSHENCCRCEKCVRTILGFRLAGAGLPEAFADDVTEDQIRRLKLTRSDSFATWSRIVKNAERLGSSHAGWVKACRATIRRSRRRLFLARLKHPLIPARNAIRLFFRGSGLSKAQLASKRTESPPIHALTLQEMVQPAKRGAGIQGV